MQAKKSRAEPGFQGFSLSSLNKARGVGQSRLGVLHVAERFANDLLGDACAFAALGGDAGRFANLTIAAAALLDRIADLRIGDTFTEADVHKQGSSWWFCSMSRILMLMRMLVKDWRINFTAA